MVAMSLLLNPRWLLDNSYGIPGGCYSVARQFSVVFKVVARVLYGDCYVIAMVYEVIARLLLWYCTGC